MAAPQGNQNARKGRLFEQALTREIKARDAKEGDGETLRKIAAKMVDRAEAGDPYATRDIRDTLDGKPAQTIQGPDGESVFGPLVAGAEELRAGLKK